MYDGTLSRHCADLAFGGLQDFCGFWRRPRALGARALMWVWVLPVPMGTARGDEPHVREQGVTPEGHLRFSRGWQHRFQKSRVKSSAAEPSGNTMLEQWYTSVVS